MATEEKKSCKKRKWKSFGIRSLFLALTAFCVWLGWFNHRVQQQKAAVDWVRGLRGIVEYDYQIKPKKPIGEPPAPDWLINNFGIDCFSSVAHVRIDNVYLDDITPISGLPNLKILSIRSAMSLSDLGPLSSCRQLESLSITDLRASDLSAVAKLKNLKNLVLYRGTDKDISAIAGCEKLKELHFGGFEPTGLEVRELKRQLPNCNVSYHPPTQKETYMNMLRMIGKPSDSEP